LVVYAVALDAQQASRRISTHAIEDGEPIMTSVSIASSDFGRVDRHRQTS
jgi:hypothetical protein